MAIAECEIKINVKGLKDLEKFLKKYGDKIQLVGSFDLQPGDILVFQLDHPVIKETMGLLKENIKKQLPDIKALILTPGIKLVNAIRKNKKQK